MYFSVLSVLFMTHWAFKILALLTFGGLIVQSCQQPGDCQTLLFPP